MKSVKTHYLLLPLLMVVAGCGASEKTEGIFGMNRLSKETSAYLLAHADNPVNWYAWGDEAFAAAEAQNKPIFLSIGYSSCHWCHVMEEESFEDFEVASLMNETFICIKVDREERPDIDNLYMRFTLALNGSGGWPMTVILTPEGKPFFAGTYIPQNTSFGRTGMIQLIPSVARQWELNREAIISQAVEIEEAVLGNSQLSSELTKVSTEIFHSGFLAFEASFDRLYGGFGNAPKFPSPHNLLFLLRYRHAYGEQDALDMVTSTLRAIRRGGIYDQIGFGIHRYSTDREWQVPHFEKMLYDQALLTMAFLEAYQITGESFFGVTASEIIDYVLRDMTSPQGAFFSSEDADSEGGEGAFYSWTVQEMSSILSQEQLSLAVVHWNVSTSNSILHESPDIVTSDSDLNSLEEIREILFNNRETRPRPARDQKILTDWNGLMIASMARASVVLQNPDYLNSAVRSFQFITENMRTEDQRLSHSFALERRGADAFLDDYSFLIWGALELYNATLDQYYLQYAVDLQKELDVHFLDDSHGGYFFTGDYSDLQMARLKESYDGAVPSGNSIELMNLLTLWKLTGESDYLNRASGIEEAFGTLVTSSPKSYSMMLAGLLYGQEQGVEVKLSGNADDPIMLEMLKVIRTGYRPWTTIIQVEPDDLNRSSDSSRVQEVINSSTVAYICRNGMCGLPLNTVIDFEESMSLPVHP